MVILFPFSVNIVRSEGALSNVEFLGVCVVCHLRDRDPNRGAGVLFRAFGSDSVACVVQDENASSPGCSERNGRVVVHVLPVYRVARNKRACQFVVVSTMHIHTCA